MRLWIFFIELKLCTLINVLQTLEIVKTKFKTTFQRTFFVKKRNASPPPSPFFAKIKQRHKIILKTLKDKSEEEWAI